MLRLLLLLCFIMSPTWSSADHGTRLDNPICAPFRGGVVDPAIVDSMLRAADEGRLYRIRPTRSLVGFCVDSAIGRVEAVFKGIEGGMALRQDVFGDASQVLVMVDTRSIEMDRPFVQTLLESEEFLEIDTYSRILFVSSGLRWISPTQGILRGMLTMHGRTQPVDFEVSMDVMPADDQRAADRLLVTAKAWIDREDYDMDRLRFLVSNTVELCMRIEAKLFKRGKGGSSRPTVQR